MFDRQHLAGLLDTSCAYNQEKVQLLEVLVNKMLIGSHDERTIAHDVLSQLKSSNEAWRVVGSILQLSKDSNTRFFALTILENCISTRWNVLPDDQKLGVKQYVTDMTLTACTDPTLVDAKYFITKVNQTLIQIVKQEWPHNWSSFIPDLCAAARTNQAVCENSLQILCSLSEDVFDFGRDRITSQRISVLMTSLNAQFQQIYDLCMFVLQNYVTSPTSVSEGLIVVTLRCLAHFLKWIPYGYIFDTGLIDILIKYFWDPIPFRVECVRCLTEIVSLKNVPLGGLDKLRESLWLPLVQKLSQIAEMTKEYDTRCSSNSRIFWETFYTQLAICLTTFLKNHRVDVCEVPLPSGDSYEVVIFVLQFLVTISAKVNHEETFKICVDFWNNFAETLLSEVRTASRSAGAVQSPLLMMTHHVDGEPTPLESPEMYSERLRRYQPVLNDVRRTLICKMARPQEVCIHYHAETGTVDRDYHTDTDEVALYNNVRESLIYLANLSGDETQKVLVDLLQKFTQDAKNSHETNWNPTELSRLCWAIGSMSGSMSVKREQNFLVHVTRELLYLCEQKRGTENKAVVASMIMYVFGQHPRFLRSHIKFLETVINKLFEFMQEQFDGVQDMACETFLKITQKCAKSLAQPQNGQSNAIPLIEKMLQQFFVLYKQLSSPKQQLMLYEGVGHVIAAALTFENRQKLIASLMKPFNDEWTQLMIHIATGTIDTNQFSNNSIYQVDVARKFTEILRVNERVAHATGTAFSSQFFALYTEMLQVYTLYSTRISQEVSQHQAIVMGHAHVKALRSMKRATLLLVQTFVESASNHDDQKNGNPSNNASTDDVRREIVQFIMPPLLSSVLQDYRTNVPEARDYEVLSLLTTLIRKLDTYILPELPRIFQYVFDCTLDMIKSDFHSFLDHRIHFYELLEASNEKCFEGIFVLPEVQRRYFIECLVWAFKHEQPTVAEQGLRITQSLLRNVCIAKPELLVSFCRVFYWSIFREIFGVLTDTLHKSGFQRQTLILMHLVQLVELGQVNDAENNITKPQVMSQLADLLLQNFGNLNRKQVEAFVLGLFNKCGNPRDFSLHIRDFLIQLKEFSGADDLFEEERQSALQKAKEMEALRQMQVPGLAPQYQPAECTRIEDFE
ncbi:exportin-1-like isoform X2 [Hylaeus volcanicus]|uniref:exportin-1-like isoform X2 n=1 Tax=Hylaeus volcanicus TaxID=313075 RepID=UPI0023B7F255|nr:exportin-1-like isoform X2 [Hylaeus volcanicus]